MTNQFLDEFQHEFEQEQTRRLRRRVYWYCVTNLAFRVLGIVSTLGFFVYLGSSFDGWSHAIPMVLAFMATVCTAVYAAVEVRDAHLRERSRDEHLRRVTTFIAITGIISSVNIFLVGVFSAGGLTIGLLAFQQILSIGFFHGMACIFLPWTWRESLRPFMPMYLINAVGMAALWIIQREAFGMFSVVFLLLYALASVGAVMPGIGIAYWRNNRFAQDFTLKAVAGRYGEMRRELSGAQRIHEALFPRPETRGSVRFDYRYEPMRSIGGDYLYARFIATDDRQEPQLLVLLLDVTGHGIPAALTVNRLYGELERLIAEQPGILPTDILRALNRYCYLTLSDHSLFVTACAFRLDHATGLLHYANAGHPPAFHRSGGVVRELEPTAMVLGVSKDLDVEIENAAVPFGPGDTLLAYTDGAMEARDKAGRMFNVDGLRDTVVGCMGASGGPGAVPMCHEVLSAVARHRYGPLTDDTLIVEIARVPVPSAPDVTVPVEPVSTPSSNGHAHTHPASPAHQPANTSAT